MGDTTRDHETKKIKIGRDTIVAEDITETIRTIAAIRILRPGSKRHTYFYLWATRQQTMKPNKIRIGRVKKVSKDSRQTMRTIATMRILRTGSKPHTYFYIWGTRQQTIKPNKIGIGRVKIVAKDIRQTMRTIAVIRILQMVLFFTRLGMNVWPKNDCRNTKK